MRAIKTLPHPALRATLARRDRGTLEAEQRVAQSAG
jgi:hypothetical protein